MIEIELNNIPSKCKIFTRGLTNDNNIIQNENLYNDLSSIKIGDKIIMATLKKKRRISNSTFTKLAKKQTPMKHQNVLAL